MELDKKLKVEALLVVHPINSKEEIYGLIFEVNQSLFISGHQQVSLIAGRVKEIANEIADKWDIFFAEKEKQEERSRPKIDKTFKVYQRDKGKRKVAGDPSIKIIDKSSTSSSGYPTGTFS